MLTTLLKYISILLIIFGFVNLEPQIFVHSAREGKDFTYLLYVFLGLWGLAIYHFHLLPKKEVKHATHDL